MLGLAVEQWIIGHLASERGDEDERTGDIRSWRPTYGGCSTSSWGGDCCVGLNQTRRPQLGFVCVVEHCGFSVTAERTRGEIHILQRGLASP